MSEQWQATCERLRDLAYDPSIEEGSWICGQHGMAECKQGSCADLPWPDPMSHDPMLDDFRDWAAAQFRAAVKDYDDGLADEMPDEAFRAYSPDEWSPAEVSCEMTP